MAISHKDFKVKNGIQVSGDASVAGTISAADPTASGHVVTKSYFEANLGSIPTAALAPSSPSNGQLWFNTVTERVNVYFSGIWMTIATITDAEVLQDHIHDTSIDGNGMIATVFVNAGELGSPQSLSVDAGNSSTTDWEETYNGGVVTDNFN
jgi:hypothetical protein|tara:strand:+ start:3184 stop:3639 length:456 start_codon:yes stop_codon:yes gene_type:complete